MNEKIRKHVNDLFQDAPNTKRVNDLKEEIISNANEKYNDLIKEGRNEEDSYKSVILGIGEVDEIILELNRTNPIDNKNIEKNRKRTALVVTISVALYILSFIYLGISDELGFADMIMMSGFFVLAGIPSCLLIYHFMSRPKYEKFDDTLVEEFKEWKQEKNNNKEVRKSISSIVWTITVIIYILISFSFGIWYISWIIFIIAGLVEEVINLLFKLGERK